MQQNLTEQMLKGIIEVLLEFRNGNTSFRIPRTNRNHFPEEVILMVNLAAEKLQANIEIPDREFLKYFVRVITVTTDFEFTIIEHSRNFGDVLGYSDLIGEGLGDFVDGLYDFNDSGEVTVGRNQCLLFPLDIRQIDCIITACGAMTRRKNGNLTISIITIHEHGKAEPKRFGSYTKYWELRHEEKWSIANIRQYIESNDGGDYSLDTLAKKFHIRARRITFVFSSFYGFYFSEFIRKTKLIRAADKVIYTKESIKTIALAEFNSYRSFYGAFVKFFGVAPGKMRHDKS